MCKVQLKNARLRPFALFMALFLMNVSWAFAQLTVTGRVQSKSGEPLIGVTSLKKVLPTVQLPTWMVILNPCEGERHSFVSYLGYKEREIAVRGRAIIDAIQLSSDDHVLDQVVVVGYGTQKKADLTGSVSIVNAEEMKKVSNSNISTMLEGKVAVYRLHQTVSLVQILV